MLDCWPWTNCSGLAVDFCTDPRASSIGLVADLQDVPVNPTASTSVEPSGATLTLICFMSVSLLVVDRLQESTGHVEDEVHVSVLVHRSPGNRIPLGGRSIDCGVLGVGLQELPDSRVGSLGGVAKLLVNVPAPWIEGECIGSIGLLIQAHVVSSLEFQHEGRFLRVLVGEIHPRLRVLKQLDAAFLRGLPDCSHVLDAGFQCGGMAHGFVSVCGESFTRGYYGRLVMLAQ